MENKSSSKSFLLLVATVVGVIVLFTVNTLTDDGLFMWMTVAILVVALLLMAHQWRWTIYPMIVCIIVLVIGSMGTAFHEKWRLPFVVNVDNTQTFVEAPANIEDPNLKNYIEKKVGFEESWFVQTFWGLYGIMIGAYVFSIICTIAAAKLDFPVIVKHWSVDAVVFVFGLVVLITAFRPSYSPDSETVIAVNQAFGLSLIGPLVWSAFVQIVGTIIDNMEGEAEASGSILYYYFIAAITYPLISGLLQVFDIDIISLYLMGEALENTSITVQKWTETQILGKFVGVFGPQTVAWILKTIKYINKHKNN